MHVKGNDTKILQLVRQWKKDDPNIDEEPIEPTPKDCCGQSCKPCVFDVHQENMIRWAIEQSKKLFVDKDKTLYESVYGQRESYPEKEYICHNYAALQIKAVETATNETLLVTFEYPYAFQLRTGCHLKARIDEAPVVRCYTPISVDYNSFTVPIKIYDDGVFTKYVKKWKIGDKVEWRGPYCNEDISSLKEAPSVLFVCAGTGLAPFVRIIDELLEDDECETMITLLYCIKTPEDILMEEKLSEWSKHWNVRVVLVFSRSEKSYQNHYIQAVFGRLNEENFQKHLGLTSQQRNSQIFVCGPTTFENDIAKYATKNGKETVQRFGWN